MTKGKEEEKTIIINKTKLRPETGPYAESRSAKRPRGTLATPPSVEGHTKKA